MFTQRKEERRLLRMMKLSPGKKNGLKVLKAKAARVFALIAAGP